MFDSTNKDDILIIIDRYCIINMKVFKNKKKRKTAWRPSDKKVGNDNKWKVTVEGKFTQNALLDGRDSL